MRLAESKILTTDTQRPALSRAAWWILGAGTLLRILFFLLSDNNGTDALARVALTADWIAHPKLQFVYGDWLPLHFWLMGGLAVILGNIEFACRLLSLVTGVASLWFVWKIARGNFSENAANFSLLVFALYSIHIGYSTTSSSEAPYLLFELSGLLCFFIYERSGLLRWLILSGICLTAGAAIRYEAWVLMFAVGLVLLGPPWKIAQRSFWEPKHLSACALFGATAGSWPIFWMSYSWLRWKQPLHFVVMNHVNVANTLAANPTSDLYRIAIFPSALLLTLSPLAFAAAFYALWLAVREPPGRQIACLVVILALVQFYQINSGGVMAFARYTITLGTLLAILSGYGFEQAALRWSLLRVRLFNTVVVAVLVLNVTGILMLSEMHWRFTEKFGSVSPRVRFPHYIKDLGDNLRGRMGPADALIIDNYNVQSNIVAAAAGLPIMTDRVFMVSAEDPSSLRSHLRTFVETKHPKYLVYSDRGTLHPYLPLPTGCVSIPVTRLGMEFRCVFSNEVYSLYEVGQPGLNASGSATNEIEH